MTAVVLTASAPLRLPLAGGGFDLPEAYGHRDVRLLSMAVAWRMRVRVTPGSAREQNGPLGWFARRRPHHVVEVDAPFSAGAGLGGSGALMVALALADAELGGGPLPDASMLALGAFRAEREELHAPVGFQDHAAAALGGVVEMEAGPDRPIELRRRDDLLGPVTRMLGECVVVAETTGRRRAAPLLDRLARHLRREDAGGERLPPTAGEFEQALVAVDGERFGELLRAHWAAKRASVPGVSTPQADAALAAAIDAGATGGKLMGAGGGGFLMIAGPQPRRERIREAVRAAGCRVHEVSPDAEGADVRVEVLR